MIFGHAKIRKLLATSCGEADVVLPVSLTEIVDMLMAVEDSERPV